MLIPKVYMYLIGMVIFFFVGNIIQWVYFSETKGEKEKREKLEEEAKHKGNVTNNDEELSSLKK